MKQTAARTTRTPLSHNRTPPSPRQPTCCPASHQGISPETPHPRQTTPPQRPGSHHLSHHHARRSRPEPANPAFRRSPRHRQLRRLEWQPHGPQHPLDRLRVLDRCQQPTRSTAVWARKNFHPKHPPQQLRPRVVAPNCATPLAWTMRHPCYRQRHRPRSSFIRPRCLRSRAVLVKPFLLAILIDPRNVVGAAGWHPAPTHRDTSPGAFAGAAPKPATAQSAPAAPSLQRSASSPFSFLARARVSRATTKISYKRSALNCGSLR
ncbi:MAG: hypothetical protein ACJAUC_004523 [Planctomycetota bacterium]